VSNSAASSSSDAKRRVAFLGLGVMGYPMAGHLAKAGLDVTVYNRTFSKAEQWVSEYGGRAARTPREAADGAELVLACVGNDDDLRSVTLGGDGAFAGMNHGTTFVDHTTASANVARELAAAASEQGLQFIDAPVSGGQAGAQNGKLTIMCGGDAQAFEHASVTLKHYAAAVTLIGPAGAGQLAKMVNQICIAGLVQGLSEAINFGESAGLDMQDDDRRQVRLRLRSGLDAQGSRFLPRRSEAQRRRVAGHGAGRSVLWRRAEPGR
jgi:2-hydroxy-3-oxopropionate reductase